VAAGGTSGRDLGTHAQHRVVARHLLCRSHSFELGIHLHHPHRFLNADYSVFDCGGVALSEDRLNLDRKAAGPILGGSPANRSNPRVRPPLKWSCSTCCDVKPLWTVVAGGSAAVRHNVIAIGTIRGDTDINADLSLTT
jgi:hypothetical protein